MHLIPVTPSHPLWPDVWHLYRDSFPWYEIRSEASQLRAFGDREYRPTIAVDDDGRLQALFFYWEYDHTIYAEHLAVNPSLRGQRIGTRVLEALIAAHPGKLIVLEIDPPEDEISIRRQHFYERIGFLPNDHLYMHPSFATGEQAHAHRLVLMSYPRPMTPEEIRQLEQYVHERVLHYVD